MHLKQIFLGLGAILYVLCSNSCQSSHREQGKSYTYDSLILGRWQQQDVNRGVICSVFFLPQGKLSLFFINSEGYSRLRPAAWRLDRDSLYITEQTRPSAWFIERLNDSSMVLSSGNALPLVFERKPK